MRHCWFNSQWRSTRLLDTRSSFSPSPLNSTFVLLKHHHIITRATSAMYARRLNRSSFSLRIDYYIVYTAGSRSFHSRIVAGHGFRSYPGSFHNVFGFCKRSQRWQSSSGAEGRNGSEGMPKPRQKAAVNHVVRLDSHVRSVEEEQREWINSEKMAIESQKKESPFLCRRERLKNEFAQRIIPWEKISVTFDKFPYYLHENTKNILVECVSSHLKQMKLDFVFGDGLRSSSGRILLQSIPGTELYRERLVRALARELKVPLLVVDNSFLTFNSIDEDCYSEGELDDAIESGEDGLTDVEADNEDVDGADEDVCNEDEWTGNNDSKSGSDEDDSQVSEDDMKKLVPCNLENFAQRVSGESQSSFVSSRNTEGGSSGSTRFPLKKGDRVKYIGRPVYIEDDKRSLSTGQRGEVYEVNRDQVAVILDVCDKEDSENLDGQGSEDSSPSVYWIHVKEIERDLDIQSEDYYIMMKALCEVLSSKQPLITYFPDFSHWMSMTVPKSKRQEFVEKVQEMFLRLGSHVVLISGLNKIDTGSKEKQKFTMVLPNFGRLSKLPLTIKRLTEGLKSKKRAAESEIDRLFTNVISISPPKDEDLFQAFHKQIEEDERIIISRRNLSELHKVLVEHELTCMDLFNVRSDGVILTKSDAEKVVGWAKNHYLSSCLLPCVSGDKLLIPKESLETAVSRLRELETFSLKPSQNLKKLAKDEYESNFVSAVVPPGEIGVKFDDIGALEDVKKSLNELVILPMRRPELFAHGNLLRPCKGILLFGPPGTGKTLIAKALATEAEANFISVTGSTLTSKWFGDAEKLTKALFSFASRLAPVIIFVDEVDSLLGARGGAFEHEATRRMRNEFMAAWDGLRSKDSQRILVLGATNRPFDLDDAVIRRLPRRIYVDLPDAGNRLKILKIIMARENIGPDFEFEKLANSTEGYSGSDLKNLCIAAAYRPVQELLEEEVKLKERDGGGGPSLRPLRVEDFIQSKAKVGPSVAYDAASMNELRKWNEQYGEGGSRRKSPFGFGD